MNRIDFWIRTVSERLMQVPIHEAAPKAPVRETTEVEGVEGIDRLRIRGEMAKSP